MRNTVVGFYYTLQPHLHELEQTGEDYSHLHELRNKPKPLDDVRPIDKQTEDYWKKKHSQLQKALYDLGVTNIAVENRKEVYGYAFLNGLTHELEKKEDPGWARLRRNALNMRRMLRKDKDLTGLIYGDNRTGKTTLSLQLTRIVHKGENEGTLRDQQIIFNDNEFQEAMKDGNQYQANHIDEMRKLFDTKDTMTSEQKTRNKMMGAFAVRNMFIIGCENNFYNVDKQFRTDKLDFCIHVPKEGEFEFYSSAKINKFEKNEDGKPITPKPDFKGNFPNLDPDNGKTDPLWKQYRNVEDKKLELGNEEEEETENRLAEIVEEVAEDPTDYIKELPGRDPIIKEDLIQLDYPELKKSEAETVKNGVEREIDPANYI